MILIYVNDRINTSGCSLTAISYLVKDLNRIFNYDQKIGPSLVLLGTKAHCTTIGLYLCQSKYKVVQKKKKKVALLQIIQMDIVIPVSPLVRGVSKLFK